jgi:hypothetical protein
MTIRVHFHREPLLAPVGVDRGVRRDLGAIDRYGAEPGQAGTPGDHQHLREQRGEPVLAVRAEPGQGAGAIICPDWIQAE